MRTIINKVWLYLAWTVQEVPVRRR